MGEAGKEEKGACRLRMAHRHLREGLLWAGLGQQSDEVEGSSEVDLGGREGGARVTQVCLGRCCQERGAEGQHKLGRAALNGAA